MAFAGHLAGLLHEPDRRTGRTARRDRLCGLQVAELTEESFRVTSANGEFAVQLEHVEVARRFHVALAGRDRTLQCLRVRLGRTERASAMSGSS